MTVRLLEPGDRVLDYSYARPDPAAIVKGGARGVLRYSAGEASNPRHPSHSAVAGKLITPREFAALRAAGLDVIANDEWYPTRITEGAGAGRDDAHAAAELWRVCGLHHGATIYVSWDADPLESQWAGALAYLKAYAAVLTAHPCHYRLGAYAGTPFLHRALGDAIDFGWRPNANSWSNDGLPYCPTTGRPKQRAAVVARALKATPAHIYQDGNTWFGGSCDENLIVRTPVGSHLDAQHRPQVHHKRPKPPPPPPEPAPAYAAGVQSPNGEWSWVLDNAGRGRLERVSKP